MYTGGHSDAAGFYLTKVENATDGLIHLPDSASESVLREIEEFADLKPEFIARKMIYKRGIFLWGPPGSGKTSTLAQLVDIVINKMQGIAFVVGHPHYAAECLKLIRKIEPHRQIVALLEDMDALVQTYGEANYLSILDGENQVDNIIFVATTNYPERMDRRFIDRPSRFDSVIKVGMPTSAARAIYLKAKEPGLTAEEVEKYVNLSEGFSIAHLREFIILTRVFRRDVDWAAQKLRAMMTESPSSSESEGDFGFTSSKKNRIKQLAEMPPRHFRP
jgi:AAA+ superfamily predicted ATPase